MGANVVKVKQPKGGDDARAWAPPFLHGKSLWFMNVTYGKHSIALYISCMQGQEILHKLLSQCGLIWLNFLKCVQPKLSLDAATLPAVNPQLIHLSRTGFGPHGTELTCLALP